MHFEFEFTSRCNSTVQRAHHSDGRRFDHLGGRHGRVVGGVREHVDDGHQRQRDADRDGQVATHAERTFSNRTLFRHRNEQLGAPLDVYHLLDHEVEVVPRQIRKQKKVVI